MSKTLYSLGKWVIKKENDTYVIYMGKKLIDSTKDFSEAYTLLQQHKKSIR